MKQATVLLTPRRFWSCALAGFVLAACATPDPATAPAPPPNTDIFIADISTIGDSLWIGALQPVAITSQYENQPYFSADGTRLLYTAAGPSGKTDIWSRTLTSGETRALTTTPAMSEYSPRLSPDGLAVTYIQENEAGDVTELHSLSLQTGQAAPVVSLKPLGYYAFLAGRPDVLTFLRSDPPALVSAKPDDSETQEIATNIGRALYAAPDGQSAYFTTATGDNTFEVNNYAPSTGQIRSLFALPDGVQDYAVFAIPGTELTGFFAGSGTDLMFRLDHPESDWVTVADFAAQSFTDISRIAVNRTATRIALVTETITDDSSE